MPMDREMQEVVEVWKQSEEKKVSGEKRGRKINCVMRRFFSKLIGRGSASARGCTTHSRRA